MNILFFLLDTVFFILVGCALLRAWMNHLRVHMQAQPGRLLNIELLMHADEGYVSQ